MPLGDDGRATAALIAGALFAPVVLGLHWDAATTVGSLAGVLTGTGSVLAWHRLVETTGYVGGGFSALPPVVVGVTVSASTIVLASTLEHVIGSDRPAVDA